jgi:hypothetical protein
MPIDRGSPAGAMMIGRSFVAFMAASTVGV